MWTYILTNGQLISPIGGLMAYGYSGLGLDKNQPAYENVAFQGPIPEGMYTVGAPYDSVDHGKYVLALIPDSDNVMFGRASFLLHGDSASHPGKASKGCIVLPRFARERVWLSGDRRLHVVPVYPSPALLVNKT